MAKGENDFDIRLLHYIIIYYPQQELQMVKIFEELGKCNSYSFFWYCFICLH